MAQKEKIPPKEPNARVEPKVTSVARPPKDRFGKSLEIGENPLRDKEIIAIQDRGDSGSRTIVISPEEIARARMSGPNGNPKGELAIEPEEIKTAGSNTMGAEVNGVAGLESDGFGRKEKILRENWDKLGHSFSWAPPQEPKGSEKDAVNGKGGSGKPKKVTFMEEYTDADGQERLRESVIEVPNTNDHCMCFTPEELEGLRREASENKDRPIAEWPQSERTNYGVEPTAGANCQIFTREEARKLAEEQGLIPKPPIADPAHTIVFTPDGKGGVELIQNGVKVKPAIGMKVVGKERAEKEKRKILKFFGRKFAGIAIVVSLIAAFGTIIAIRATNDSEKIKNMLKTKTEIYEENIFANKGNIEDSVILKAAQILDEKGNIGPLHFTQILDIFDWMTLGNNLKYVSVDKGHEPRRAGLTLEAGQGDCKNLAMLVVAMELSIGNRVAVIRTEPEMNEYGDNLGHVYNAVRIYKPTVEEQKDPEKKAKKYEEIREAVRKIIFSGRYPHLVKPEIIETAIIEDPQKEGLWLVLDATYEEDGWPGRQSARKITEFIKFGPEYAEVRGILE